MKTPYHEDKIALFDLHCDTFLKLYYNNCSLYNSKTHISYDKLKCFSPYIQVGAIWSDSKFSNDDSFANYLNTINHLKSINIETALSVNKLNDLSFILAVEDARLLNGDITRLDKLYKDGVRFLTLNWKGESCIGGGWDTCSPLTSFGKEVVKKCADEKIIIDLSHSSVNVQKEVIEMASIYSFSPVFSHSDSYSVCHHKRNIADGIFKEIVAHNGLVGISLAPMHLENNGEASIYSLLTHIEKYLELGGENSICLGCDVDGVDSLPKDISSIADLSIVHSVFIKEFGKKITDKIYFSNAYNYALKNLV